MVSTVAQRATGITRTKAELLATRETVCCETPAARATSAMETGRELVSLDGRLATGSPSPLRDLNSVNAGPGRSLARAEARYRRTHVNVLYFFYRRFFCSICPYSHTVHGRKSTDYQILKK